MKNNPCHFGTIQVVVVNHQRWKGGLWIAVA